MAEHNIVVVEALHLLPSQRMNHLDIKYVPYLCSRLDVVKLNAARPPAHTLAAVHATVPRISVRFELNALPGTDARFLGAAFNQHSGLVTMVIRRLLYSSMKSQKQN